MKKNILIIFVSIILFIIILFFLTHKPQKDHIYGSGIIEIKEVLVTSQIPGIITAIYANQGDSVKKGDTLVIIEHKELIAQKQEALAGLGLVRQTAKEIEIKEKNLTKDLERARNLYKAGELSEKELESIESQYEILNVQKEKIKAQIAQAEAKVSLISVQIEHTFILSPTNGIILNRYYESGEFVNPASPILKIGDISETYLKIYLSEKDLGRIRLGNRTRVYVDAYPEEHFSGEVTYISSEAEFTPKNIQTRDERAGLVFAVKITIHNPEKKLLPGMTADASIIEE